MSPYFSRDIYVRNKKLDVSPNGWSVAYTAETLLQQLHEYRHASPEVPYEIMTL
jgi:hypothetical protein